MKRKLWLESLGADLTITDGTSEYRMHSQILMSNSEYFYTWRTNSPGVNILRVNDLEAAKLVCKYMYELDIVSDLDKISDECFIQFLNIANEWLCNVINNANLIFQRLSKMFDYTVVADLLEKIYIPHNTKTLISILNKFDEVPTPLHFVKLLPELLEQRKYKLLNSIGLNHEAIEILRSTNFLSKLSGKKAYLLEKTYPNWNIGNNYFPAKGKQVNIIFDRPIIIWYMKPVGMLKKLDDDWIKITFTCDFYKNDKKIFVPKVGINNLDRIFHKNEEIIVKNNFKDEHKNMLENDELKLFLQKMYKFF